MQTGKNGKVRVLISESNGMGDYPGCRIKTTLHHLITTLIYDKKYQPGQ
jgi:hypothetical protein